MLLYILWEVKSQVYRIWPHFKTPPTTFFDWSCRSEGISFFAEQNEQVQYSAHLQAFKTISKTNTERTLPNKNEQKTNSANSKSTGFELLCSVVRRGLWYTPCTYAHTCATLPCEAFSGCGSGNLSAQTRRSQIGSQCESYRHPENHAGKGFS